MKLQALAIGAVLGFMVAVTPSCGKKTCGPSNCTGCCNGDTCVAPSANGSNTTCGTSGLACVDCASKGQTCSTAFTCVGQGGQGGGMGGTGGGSGGGSSGSCGPQTCISGCCNSGVCVPQGSQSPASCGTAGAVCSPCTAGQECRQGSCQTPTIKVGDACTDDAQCSQLGGNFICKKMTTAGNGTYSGGYCTKKCEMPADCGSDSTCVGLSPAYGEADAICWKNCTMPNSAPGGCRSGYACYGLTGGASACWIYPVPPVDAGTPSDKVGIPCTTYTQCANPPDPQYAACITPFLNLPDGGSSTTPTGYTDGYCTADCSIDSDLCGDDAICLGGWFEEDDAVCLATCNTPWVGQSNCRNGYACTGYVTGLPDGGRQPSTDGFCAPSCAVPGAECSDAGYCDAGYCLPKP